jgi:hypothetical protein
MRLALTVMNILMIEPEKIEAPSYSACRSPDLTSPSSPGTRLETSCREGMIAAVDGR